MLKGILVGLGIMVVCWMIPVAHFVLGPLGPFVAGYFGISYAEDRDDSDAALALRYGLTLALASFVPVGLGVAGLAAASQVWGWFDFSARVIALIAIGSAVFVLYTGSMACLGAMFARLRRRNRETQKSSP